jgi:hypothetical protein
LFCQLRIGESIITVGIDCHPERSEGSGQDARRSFAALRMTVIDSAILDICRFHNRYGPPGTQFGGVRYRGRFVASSLRSLRPLRLVSRFVLFCQPCIKPVGMVEYVGAVGVINHQFESFGASDVN